jgi:hypothetical protein
MVRSKKATIRTSKLRRNHMRGLLSLLSISRNFERVVARHPAGRVAVDEDGVSMKYAEGPIVLIFAVRPRGKGYVHRAGWSVRRLSGVLARDREILVAAPYRPSINRIVKATGAVVLIAR